MSSRLVAKDAEGLNAGADPALLRDFVTPVDLLFTRSHAPVPSVDPGTYRLRVHGMVSRELTLTLGDLAGMARREETATLVCAGIRRSELEAVRPVPGELPWGAEPIGTGRWSGVPLADILALAGLDHRATHIEFIGLDRVERGGRVFGFGGSIPREKALGGEVLLADRLNGAPLPAEHGFPLRVVVPGYYGARSVKWLGEVVAREGPSPNYFQTQAYRVLRTPSAENPRDVSAGTELGELVLNSVITSHAAGDRVAPGPAAIAGWANGTGGRPPARVEVSTDGGAHWMAARLSGEGRFTWRQWRAEVTLPPGLHDLVVRAVDHDGRGQPAGLAEVWNVKGYANNAWHRVTVRAGN